VVTAGMKPSAKIDITLSYPMNDPQTARAELIRRGPGRWTSEALGRLPAYVGKTWTVMITHTVTAGEFALMVHTGRAEEAL